MRIAIDLTAVKNRGTQVYLGGFLTALINTEKTNEYLVFLSPSIGNNLDNSAFNFHFRNVNWARKVPLRVFWELVILPLHLMIWKADVLFSPFDISPFVAPCPVLLGVHDPNYFDFKGRHLSTVSYLAQLVKSLLVLVSCWRAALVFFPTQATADELGEKLKIPRDKRGVVHHGTDIQQWTQEINPEETLAKYSIGEKPYILFASTLYRKKHPDDLIKAFGQLAKKDGFGDFWLVFAGDVPDREFEDFLEELIRKEGIFERVKKLGMVPHEEMPALYQNASVFVLPTIKETFCHPYVEAMASGVPIICVDMPVAREVCGDAGIYFPARDIGELCKEMAEVLSNAAVRRSAVEKGIVQAKRYNWNLEAEQTLALLERVVSSHIV